MGAVFAAGAAVRLRDRPAVAGEHTGGSVLTDGFRQLWHTLKGAGGRGPGAGSREPGAGAGSRGAYPLPARTPLAFVLLGCLIGIVPGGSQALSRSLFAQMIPHGREAVDAARGSD